MALIKSTLAASASSNVVMTIGQMDTTMLSGIHSSTANTLTATGLPTAANQLLTVVPGNYDTLTITGFSTQYPTKEGLGIKADGTSESVTISESPIDVSDYVLVYANFFTSGSVTATLS